MSDSRIPLSDNERLKMRGSTSRLTG